MTEPRASTPRPSAPWHGAVITLLLWGGFAWLLAYTLLDLDWQQSLGGWNYVLLLGLVPVLSVLMKRYRPDLRRHLDPMPGDRRRSTT